MLLKTMDRLLAWSATHLLTDSASQRQFLADQGITDEEKLSVLADGSISGVDVEKFRPDTAVRSEARRELGITDDAVLLLFLGRLNRDKGVLDLADAFANVAPRSAQLHLLLVGPDEGDLKEEIKDITAAFPDRLHFIDYTDRPEACFAAADVFCLPSYREGFGTSVIEAAACGLPAVASRIYGLTDAVEEGVTGLLFPPGNMEALAAAMNQLAIDDALRLRLGRQARERAIRDFSSEQVTRAWLDYYAALL
jgi:glycosyltransferase involved in cell wall biosynthesis